MYPRFMSLFFVNLPKSYWHTQLPCTQGSKLYFLNCCTPNINVIAGSSVPSGCAHMIYIAASVANNFLQPTQFLIAQGSRYHYLLQCTQQLCIQGM